eukprot:GHRR01026691.1.p1 GENE.GHRR01026691.1~~GHRR01026691.1.p1  ORF type:complete len:269 (+),score=50.26 GHRR01026691.1:846-1652(+)
MSQPQQQLPWVAVNCLWHCGQSPSSCMFLQAGVLHSQCTLCICSVCLVCVQLQSCTNIAGCQPLFQTIIELVTRCMCISLCQVPYCCLYACSLKVDDPFHVNEVFTAVWNFMALYPLIYAAILVPGARTNKLPAWPFVCAAVFLGAYALIPYMCLWSPKQPPEQLPPTAAELEGWSKFYMRAAETPWLPLGLIAGSAYWLYYALVAGGQEWIAYIQFFDESRLAHATSLDCMLCTVLLPFWMNNDALGRRWESRYTKLLMGNTTNVEH